MCAAALYMWWHSKRDPVSHNNVNDAWEEPKDKAEAEATPVAGGTH